MGTGSAWQGSPALGLDGYPAHTRAEAETALEKAQRAGCALILVTAEAARLVSERLDRLRQKEGPLVLILPDEAKPGQADRALETVLRQGGGRRAVGRGRITCSKTNKAEW